MSNFGHKRWRVTGLRGTPSDRLGSCDYEKRAIRIPMDGDTKDELDTIIHEAIHASNRRLIEDEVDMMAGDITRLIWSLGWRKK